MALDHEQREYERHNVSGPSPLHAEILLGDDRYPCHVIDVSAGGACVELNVTAEKDEFIVLNITDFGSINARVAWVKSDRLGLHFKDDPALIGEMLISLATYG